MKTGIIIIEMRWKMVICLSKAHNKYLDHFIKDNLFGDYHSGLFGILDGHGGFKVSQFCTRSIPEVKKTQLYSNFVRTL